MQRLARRRGVAARLELHQFLKLSRGIIGEEKDSLAKSVVQPRTLSKPRDLALLGGRGRVKLEVPTASKHSTEHPACHWSRQRHLSIRKVENGGVLFPIGIFGGSRLVAAGQLAKFCVNFHQNVRRLVC